MEENTNRLNAAAALLQNAFHNRNNADNAPLRQLNTIAKGFDSVSELLHDAPNAPYRLAQEVNTHVTASMRKKIQDVVAISGEVLALGDAFCKELGDVMGVLKAPAPGAAAGAVPIDALGAPHRESTRSLIAPLISKLIEMPNRGSVDRQIMVLGEVLLGLLQLEPDVGTSRTNHIISAVNEVQNLLVQQADTFFDSLLGRTAEETPEIKQFFDEAGLADFTDKIVPADARFMASGGYADVYRLTLSEESRREVAVKVLKVSQDDIKTDLKINTLRRRLRREIHVWSRAHHRNIVPLFGLTHRFNKSILPSMVSPWMEGGTLTGYLSKNEATLTLRERFQLLLDIISGLCHLHVELNTIHGDLTSANILIDQNTACLSDFGLAEIISEFPGTSYMTSRTHVAGARRWAAPELFQRTYDHYDNALPIQVKKPCDIYSYGCVAQEVMSGKLPHFDINVQELVINRKMRGSPPPRPPGIADDIWCFIQLCWRGTPEERPEANQVSRKLENIHQQYSNHSPEELESTLNMTSGPPAHAENTESSVPTMPDGLLHFDAVDRLAFGAVKSSPI